MNNPIAPLSGLLVAFIMQVSAVSAASINDTAQSEQRNWQLGVSLGYGSRSNPLVDADNLDLIAVVDLSWYGERFFFDNGDVGFTFQDNQHYTLNGVLRINTERLFFENANSLLVSFASSGVGTDGSDPVQDGVTDPTGTPTDGGSGGDPGDGNEQAAPTLFDIPDRDYAIEAGVEFLTDGRWGFLQASVFQDVSSNHKGYEASINLGRSGHWQRFTWTASAGISYRSAKLNDYYYGILPAESQTGFAAYSADSGVNYQASALMRYYLSKSLSLGLVLEYEALNDAIANSPFVDNDYVTTGYAGIKYTF